MEVLVEKRQMLECPVCENKKWEKIYQIDNWSIKKCSICGFACLDPLPHHESRPDYFSEEKIVLNNAKKRTGLKKFSRTLKSFFKNLTKRDKSQIFVDKLCHYLPKDAEILDIGCGDGSFLRKAKNNFTGTGIEISDYLASLAKKDSDLTIFSGDFIDTDFKGKKFKGITLISLLEHLDDPRQAMQKCFDLLDKNGVLLLKTVNYGCLNRWVIGKEWTGFRPPDHLVYFTPTNLICMLKKIGFSKIKFNAWPLNDNMYCDAIKG